MKYHSNPKPVRIRIESGGEEHFSLGSLLRCFHPKDIIGKKNELLRWLDFQGEEGKRIINELREIDFNRDSVYAIYKAFFPIYIKEKGITKTADLFAQWYNDEDYRINFSFLQEFCFNDEYFVERLYSEKCTKELDIDWLGVMENLVCEPADQNMFGIAVCIKKEIKNPNLLYYIGILYRDKKEYDRAKQFLKMAKDKGCEKSIKQIIYEIEELSKANRFCEVRKAEIEECINYMFRYKNIDFESTNDVIINALSPNTIQPNKKERAILDLAFAYFTSLKIKDNFKRPSGRFFAIIKGTITNENDFLKYEKDFIRILSGYDEGGTIKENSQKEMKRLAETYVPAEYLVDEQFSNCILDKHNFRNKKVPEQIEFILRYIFCFE